MKDVCLFLEMTEQKDTCQIDMHTFFHKANAHFLNIACTSIIDDNDGTE